MAQRKHSALDMLELQLQVIKAQKTRFPIAFTRQLSKDGQNLQCLKKGGWTKVGLGNAEENEEKQGCHGLATEEWSWET